MANGTRKHERILLNYELVWAIEWRGLSGRGKLVDVSAGGLCIQINGTGPIEHGAAISIVCSRLPALPSSARVMWTCRTNGGAATLCGLGFVQAGSAWPTWIAANVAAAGTAASRK